MKLNKTEKFIKQKMQSYEADVDTGKLMDALKDHLPQKRKRPYPFWIFLMVGFMLIGAGSIYLIDSQGEGEKGQSSISAIGQKQLKNNSKNFNKPEVAESDFESKLVVENLKEKSIAKAEKKQDNSSIKKETPTINNTVFTENQNKQQEELTALNVQIEALKKDIFPQGRAKETDNNKILNPIKELDRKIALILLKPRKEYFDLQPVQLMERRLSGRRAYALYFGLGAGRSNMNFMSNDTESEPFADYVNSISEQKNSFSFKMGANIYLSKGLYLNTGIEVKQLVTRFHTKWQKTEEEKNISATGGSQTVTRENTYEAIGHNYHYLFDLPLGLGVELFQSRYFSLAIQSDVALNVFRDSHGYRINSDQRLLAYNSSDADPYKKPLGFTFGFSIPVYYRLNDRWHLMLKPEYKNRIIEFDQSILKLKEHYHTFYLNIGAKYEF